MYPTHKHTQPLLPCSTSYHVIMLLNSIEGRAVQEHMQAAGARLPTCPDLVHLNGLPGDGSKGRTVAQDLASTL